MTRASRPEPTAAAVFNTACGLLARRDHGTEELRRKLRQRRLPTDLVDATIDRLRDLGYLDDGRVARQWAETCIQHRLWGPHRVDAFLHSRGIAPALIRQIHADAWPAGRAEATARQALGKKYRHSSPTRRQAAAFLAGRGFPADIAFTLTADLQPDDDSG